MSRFAWPCLVCLPLITIAACGGHQLPLKYPETPRGATVDVYHGTSVADPYRALEDLDAPETAAWVEAQNALSVPFLEALPRRSELIERFTRLWSWERYSPPEKHGSRYFFRYDDGKRDHAVLMVADDLAEKARVLLDPNGFSKDRTSSLSRYKVSPDGALIAYAISEGGSDWRHWRVRDVATGQDRMDRIEHTKFTDVSWTPDGSAFYYSRYPTGSDGKADDRQQVTLYRHVLGESQAEDTEIYRVKAHPTRNAYGRVTSDGQTLIVTITDGYLANDIYTMSLTSTCGTVR
ncbi:MAG: prolyl oligopeptidase, partial [Myxococcota bacterium]